MTLFASTDAHWVGTRIGAAALAAVTTSLFWVWMAVSVAELVSVGLTAVAARRHGEGQPEVAARTAGDALLLALALGVTISIAGRAFLPQLFVATDVPDDVAALGRSYLGVYLAGMPLIFGYFAIDAAFRAAGDARTPFLLLASSVVVTLIIDPLLIVGAGPFPELGVAGAALATVTTRGVVFIAGGILLWRRGMIVFGRPSRHVLGSIARIGLPTAATGVAFSVIYVVVARTISGFGTPAVAALGLGHRIESWLYMVGVGFGAAAAALVGQNLGAGQFSRARRAGWMTAGWASAAGVVIALIQLVVAEPLAGLFTTDAAVVAESVRYLRTAALAQMFVCAEVVLEGAMGGAGYTLSPMLASTSITLLRIPLCIWAASTWGTIGVWWVLALTAAGRGLAMIVLWHRGRWAGGALQP